MRSLSKNFGLFEVALEKMRFGDGEIGLWRLIPFVEAVGQQPVGLRVRIADQGLPREPDGLLDPRGVIGADQRFGKT